MNKTMEMVHPIFSKSQDAPNQFDYNLPKRLGSGIIRANRFSSGLTLLFMDLCLTSPISLSSEITGWGSGMSFNLTGHSDVRSSEHRQILSAIPDTDAYYVYSYPQILEEDIAATRKVKVSILFDKKTLLDFVNEDEEPFLPFLKGLQNQTPVSGQGKMAPKIQRALNQLVDCPYSGKTRAIFLEGKMMEIFAHELEELRVKGKGIPRQPRISASDIERIHFSAELLVRDPVNPPDLTDLARKIGMGKSKFYQNFKSVFGHSPVVHLRSHRLRIARQLLRQGKHNVTEVAFAVGFNNLSYFARVFVDKFGVPPHQTR
ncbi:AraC family transcriptional regulator [uncultured Desulfobacter sp.]|uniref:helix-turn-helix transcriptional regulator n=1 Tax=uncultured Desulfobacter sp. TaxID=240139 RepID=UPI0029F52403|nr:AraC family transcriptional regulator [uncultured Desulfobacter sp.]